MEVEHVPDKYSLRSMQVIRSSRDTGIYENRIKIRLNNVCISPKDESYIDRRPAGSSLQDKPAEEEPIGQMLKSVKTIISMLDEINIRRTRSLFGAGATGTSESRRNER